jgi:hypothetical protein
MRVSVKSLVVVGAVAALALAIGLMSQGTALADPPTPFPQPGDGDTTITVPTEALNTGVGQPPLINYKWENVDMDPAEGVWAYFDALSNADDDPADPGLDFWPWLGDDPDPCVCGVDNDGDGAIDEDPIDGDDNDGDGAIDEDDACLETRLVRFWAAVDDPNGLGNIDEVWVNVYEPNDNDGDTLVDEDPEDDYDNDGDGLIDEDPPDRVLKYKRHMVPVGCSELGTYNPTTTPPTVTLGSPLEAAVQTDQLTEAEAKDVVVKCYKEEKKIYWWEDNVSKEQPAGEYTVEVIARDKQGNDSAPKINYFTVISIVGLVIDFSGGVNFGEIFPATEQVVSGDEDMSTPAAPTVMNIGNDPMYLWLHWYPMVGQRPVQPMEITTFDATFMGEKLYFDASVQRGFCEHLCANEFHELDLSVDPPDILYADTYIGSLDVMGAHQPDPQCPRAP